MKNSTLSKLSICAKMSACTKFSSCNLVPLCKFDTYPFNTWVWFWMISWIWRNISVLWNQDCLGVVMYGQNLDII